MLTYCRIHLHPEEPSQANTKKAELMDLFRCKSIERSVQEEGNAHSFKKVLNGFHLILLGIGCIVGTGIFVLTGTAAAAHAGPALAISFIISGLGCLCAGLCYAEFSSAIPLSGSAYSYAYATIGEFIAWIIGWDLILEYLVGAATVASGWSGYAVKLLGHFGLRIPPELSQAALSFEGEHFSATGAYVNLPAVFVIVLITCILMVGIQESALVNSVIVAVKLIVIVAFILFCFPHVKTSNWVPFIPPNTGHVGVYGWTGILAAAGVIFYAYIGFDAVCCAAQEVVKPSRDLPIGILGSLLICTVLYILVSLVLTGLVPYKELNVAAPVALAVERCGPTLGWLRLWIEVGALGGLSSVVLVLLLAQPRIFHRMAMDGLFPKTFAQLHPKFRTPTMPTLLTGVCAAALAGLLPIDVLSSMVSIGTLLAFTIVCTSIVILRKTRPDLERQFRTPWVPFIPIAGAIICFGQMLFLPLATWIRLVAWLVIGMAIYFGYSYRHSRLNRRAKDRLPKN
jgi:APA family basic amino acid/polyamine antiporter